MALSPENNWVEVLQNLPLYEEYEKFDKVDIKNENSSHCNDLGNADEEDKTLCKKVVQNLSQLSALEDDKKIKNSCYYFQHWFFDNIEKKYYNGSKKGTNYAVAEKLFNIVSEFTPIFTKMTPCNCNESGSPDVWKKEKYLHAYFENHQYIKCSNSGKDRCEKYVNYVTYIKTLYEDKEEDCCYGEELDPFGVCEHYFKCENRYSPENLLTELKKELQLLEKKLEAGGGEETLQAKKSEKIGPKKSGQEEKKTESAGQEKTKPENAEAGASSPKGEDGASAKPSAEESGATQPGARTPAPATPVEEKPATTIPTPPEPALVKPAPAKPVAAKPKETVSEEKSAEREEVEEEANEDETAEGLTVEEVTTEEVVAEMPSTMQHEEALGSQPVESVEQGVHAISSYNTEPASNAIPLTIADSTNTLGATHEEFDSNFFRNVIMAIAVLGTIFFLFYYNRSSRLESSLRKKKRKKKKIFEHNYYEEYEKELEMYGSEETFLDSETDRLYLNYHPDQDSYY
ncbi:Plasmodium vivax Vir protein, putative [Plasmodium vivax]|uniref:Vir protein, putative n=1 Tax=Plasmodium vivax TaxID=5855 RepID=A0A1G4EIA2_PLAVI|nr:Plasmodium vivax Vir protein, putative [Plasmodium vivax]